MMARSTKRRRLALESLEDRALMTAGALDTTFGGTGMVTTYAGSAPQSTPAISSVTGMAVQPDLKTVEVGPAAYSTGSSSYAYGVAVVRYNANGGLDTAFGSGGEVLIKSNSAFVANFNVDPHFDSVQIQPDGKIVVASNTQVTYGSGRSAVTRDDLLVVRLNPNGSLDTTFGKGGEAVLDFPSGDVAACGLILQPGGQIVVCGGNILGDSGPQFLVARLTSAGALDTTFGPNGQGYDSVNAGNTSQVAQSAGVDAAGDILVGGHAINPATKAAAPAVVAYTPSGKVDTAFGNAGTAFFPVGTYANGIYAIGLQPSGGVVIAGDLGQTPNYGSVGVARLIANGSVDTTFGTNGYFFDSTMFAGYGLAVQPNGEIILAGRGAASPSVSNPNGFFVDRILANGSGRDTAFGTAGQTQVDFPNLPANRACAVAVGPDGKITIGGSVDVLTEFGSMGVYVYSFATARLLNDITSNTTAAAAVATSPASASVGPGIAPLVLDSPDFWDVLRPSSRRLGPQ